MGRNKIIVGFIGLARAGKDTAADRFVRAFAFQKMAFADPLKQACKIIFSLNDEQVYGDQKEIPDQFWGVSPRYILQKVGTECLRNNFDKDIWIKSFERKIELTQKDVVVSDVRFLNEVNAIKNKGGYIIKISRDSSGASGGISGHASESELSDYRQYDYFIDNNSSIEELHKKVEAIYESIITNEVTLLFAKTYKEMR